MYDTFQRIGEKHSWSFEVIHLEETFRKDGEKYHCLIRKLMFGRYLLQSYLKDTQIVMDFKTIDEPTEEQLEKLFQLGEKWIEVSKQENSN